MRDLLPDSYDKRAFQTGEVRLEDNEILSEKGTQDRPIVERISNGEVGRVVGRDEDGPYPLVKVEWDTGGTSWVFDSSIRNVRR